MTDLKQAAQQALEALESGLAFDAHSTVLQNLREALEQPEQEPVAYYHPHKGFYWAKPTHISAPTVVDVPPVPLYVKWIAAQRKPLTDEEIWQIATDCTIGGDLHADKFARAIEAAHGIKEKT